LPLPPEAQEWADEFAAVDDAATAKSEHERARREETKLRKQRQLEQEVDAVEAVLGVELPATVRGNGAAAKGSGNGSHARKGNGSSTAAATAGSGYVLSEDNIALVFATQYCDALRYSCERHRWHQWDGNRWREDNTDLAYDWVRSLTTKLNIEGKVKWSSAAAYAAIERIARTDRRLAVPGDLWDADPLLLCTPEGTLDLSTGTMRESRPADYMTKSTHCAPAAGRAELWRQFLKEVTQGDELFELFLRQIAGYCLTGLTNHECLFYLYGPGGNGKGTFIGALLEVLGDYAVAANMDTFLSTRGHSHPTELAMLRGARMVSASETEEGRTFDTQRVKQLTGSDMISARFMRQDFFQFKPTFKLLLLGNAKPNLRAVDAAWRRRIHIVPFRFNPKIADSNLKFKLRAEYPQIMQWALDGWLDLRDSGLVIPKVVRDETLGYLEVQDLVTQWAEGCCEFGRDYYAANTDLYASWSRFCEQIGERPASMRTLSDRLQEMGVIRVTNVQASDPTGAGARGRGFRGLRVRLAGS
jgi:putative DNA primase/helicase